MKGKQKILGIIGGMGTRATIDFLDSLICEYEKYLNVEKEWDYPRFILDNNCKLPSRVRHIVYGEESPLKGMIESANNLISCGADVIVIPCNTAHYFLEDIRKNVSADFLDIIKSVFLYLHTNSVKKIKIIASEGTVNADLYGKHANRGNIDIYYEKNLKLVRSVIEDVKKGTIGLRTLRIFKKILTKDCPNILGCTELSCLFNKHLVKSEDLKGYNIVDAEHLLIKDIIIYLIHEDKK